MSCMSSYALIWITVGFLKIIQIKYKKQEDGMIYTLKSLLEELRGLRLEVGGSDWAGE